VTATLAKVLGTVAVLALASKVVLIRLGTYMFVNKVRGGESPKFFYAYFVMSQLYETEIP
jgi:hypothetical protein